MIAEQSDGHQAADRPSGLLETLLAAAGSSAAFASRFEHCFDSAAASN